MREFTVDSATIHADLQNCVNLPTPNAADLWLSHSLWDK
jgi:hypothetical protein